MGLFNRNPVPFRERNPVIIGLVSLAVIMLMLIGAFRADSLPLIGGGDTYYADFGDASGLKVDDPVRVAGVRVGKVESIDLSGGHVKVGFKIDKKVDLGDDTGAEIKVATILGQMFLALDPSGNGELKHGATIPTSRTTSAYDIVQAFSGLAKRTQKIDTSRLAKSFNTLAAVTKDTPASFRGTLKGLSALSETIASRDSELNTLLQRTRSVSAVLAQRDGDIITLMHDADTLLNALVQRRASVHRLLVSTSQLSQQLTGLVNDSRADLKPALSNLQSTLQLLLRNQNNLDDSLRLLAPFYRVFTNTLANGPWFETWIQNLGPGGGSS